MKTAASSGSSSPSSISILAESASTTACWCGVTGRDRGDERRRRAQVPLADVEQHHDRLLGEEPEAADGLLVVRVQVLVADRRAGIEPRLQAAQDDPFVLGGLALGLCPVAAAADQTLEPSIGHGEVGHEELEVEALEVPGRVDAAFRVRDGRILERADHVEQRIGVAQPREVVGRQLLGPDVPLGRRRAARAGPRT